MPVVSTKPFIGVPRDVVANFNGKQIVYVYWEQHLLFATPLMLIVEPGMRFGDLLDQVAKPLIQADPDAAAVNLRQVAWQKSGQPWSPDFDATLATNGIMHKTQLSFATPGLNSLLVA